MLQRRPVLIFSARPYDRSAPNTRRTQPTLVQLRRCCARRLVPQSARTFEAMATQEDGHRASIIEEHRRRFGDAIPLIRREHVAGFYQRRPIWLIENLGVERIRDEAARMETETRDFYQRAAQRTTDASTRELLNRLAAVEYGHEATWQALMREHLPPGARAIEAAEAHRQFVLTWVQPGLAGLMDGSVSTLAPIFAAAFATGDTWRTFLVGFAASVGAGISMGFTEAASDDGTISGPGSPFLVACSRTACKFSQNGWSSVYVSANGSRSVRRMRGWQLRVFGRCKAPRRRRRRKATLTSRCSCAISSKTA
jgi:rubrerythrin